MYACVSVFVSRIGQREGAVGRESREGQRVDRGSNGMSVWMNTKPSWNNTPPPPPGLHIYLFKL